ncbi:MAG: sugar phosphate isomerase/epimerase family protein [Bacteroidota bacterium]
MKVGFSFPYRYLSGTPESQDEHILVETFGPPATCLELLRRRGVASIELGRINTEADPGEIRQAGARVFDAGLGLTLHGYLPDLTVEGGFTALFPPLAALAGLLGQKQARALMVLHSYRGTAEDDPAVFKERNISFLRRLTSALAQERINLRVAVEVTRNQGRVDPSTSYEDLLEVRERVGWEDLGFCWDVGHTQWNVDRGKLSPQAPPEFVRNIIHTHLHDLAADGQTHWPLTERRLPLGTYLSALKAVDYQGVYNIEFYPSRWAAVRDVKDSYLASLEIVKALAGEGRKRPVLDAG